MRLLKFEVTKLVRSPAIFLFLAACLITNISIVLMNSHKREIDYLNKISKVTGFVYNDEYMEKLKTITEPDESLYSDYWIYNSLVQGAENLRNTFEDMEGGDKIQNSLLSKNTPYSKITIKIQQWKYRLYSPIIKEKAESADDKFVYFGSMSNYIHESIFIITGQLFAAECCIFFILIMLWSLGFENMAGTELVTYSTKTGRRLALYKSAAALLLGTAFFIIIYTSGYGLTFLINDLSQILRQNISAQYHTVREIFLGSQPFLTWSSMTVREYFFSSVFIAFLNGLVAALFTIPFGLLIKNVYAAFSSVAGAVFINIMFYLYGLQTDGHIPFLWNLSLAAPLPQIVNNDLWFSDGGMRMLLPRFELFYPLFCLIILCPIVLISAHKFRRKEII